MTNKQNKTRPTRKNKTMLLKTNPTKKANDKNEEQRTRNNDNKKANHKNDTPYTKQRNDYKNTLKPKK